MRGVGRLLRCQAGVSLTLVVVTLPVLLAVLGTVIDSGLYGLAVVRLSSAADAAALAAASAVDFPYYATTGQVRIDQSRAQVKAERYAALNYEGSVSTTVTVVTPRRVKVDLSAEYRPLFFRAFGIEKVRVNAGADAQVG